MEGDIRDALTLAGQLRGPLAVPEPPRLEQKGHGCSYGWISGYLRL